MKPPIELKTEDFLRDFNTLAMKDFPEGFAEGMRDTTRQARDMGRVRTELAFDLHTMYLTNLVQNLPESPSQMAAAEKAAQGYGDIRGAVYIRGGMGRNDTTYLKDHEDGGTRTPNEGGSLAIPSADLDNYRTKTGTGRTNKRWKPSTLLEYYNTHGPNTAGNKLGGGRGKGRPRNGKPFIMQLKNGKAAIVRRRTSERNNLEFLYTFSKDAKIKPKWSFEETVRAAVEDNYVSSITNALNRRL